MRKLLVQSLVICITIISGFAQEKTVRAVNSISDLLSINPTPSDTVYIAEGLQTTDDGSGGIMRYYTTDTTATNATTVFKPYRANGRWIMLISAAGSLNTNYWQLTNGILNPTVTNIVGVTQPVRVGTTNALPNFSTVASLNVRGPLTQPGLIVDSLVVDNDPGVYIYTVVTNNASAPQVHFATASVGSPGTTAIAIQSDALADSAGTTLNPLDSSISGTIGFYANAQSTGTNTSNTGIIGTANQGRGQWNVGVVGWVNPNAVANPTSTNVAVFGRISERSGGSGQTLAAAFFEALAVADSTNAVVNTNAVLISDARSSGWPVFIGKKVADVTSVITGDGRAYLLGTTNFITFGATNNAPVTPGTVDKWISVSINGESTEYRLPLFK